ncbi:MAG: UV DNA damage repair endonuclease UvsE [Gemmatimonadota bacterium]
MTSPVRLGLCCQFLDSPIKFRTATHTYVSTLTPARRRAYLQDILLSNARTLALAVRRCHELGIGAFRINSQIAPLATHPKTGYTLDAIDRNAEIIPAFRSAGALARELDIRLSFHPDQFVVLNSARETVVQSSVTEMNLQATMAELVGADTLTLHGGGMTGGKPAALERLALGVERLGAGARLRLALENDDRQFAPADLLPLCNELKVPLVYDVHHHRCLPDGLSVADASTLARATWGTREPWMHISSPRDGWAAANPRPHADYIDPADFPVEWRGMRITVDVEAKAKERAVLAMREVVKGEG